MLKILRALQSEQSKIRGAAEIHQADDHVAFGEMRDGLGQIKEGQEKLHAEVKTLASAVAKITPTVDELKSDKIRALERAAVIRELADEKARAAADADKVAVIKDRADERRSRWLGPLLGAAATAILALAGGWANDHFHRTPEVKSQTTITSTVDRPK